MTNIVWPVGQSTKYPLIGYKVSTVFLANNDNYRKDKPHWYHTGIDINSVGGGDSDFGHPVYSIMKGIVLSVGWFPYWGNVILINHSLQGAMIYSQYAHLDTMLVKVNEEVSMGQFIGTIGKGDTSKSSMSAHLHFEIRKNLLKADSWIVDKDFVTNNYVNPLPFLRKGTNQTLPVLP